MPRTYLSEHTRQEGIDLVNQAFASLGPCWAGAVSGSLMHVPLTCVTDHSAKPRLMDTPVRGKDCQHVRCFDADMDWAVDAEGRGPCPVCRTRMKSGDLMLCEMSYALINHEVRVCGVSRVVRRRARKGKVVGEVAAMVVWASGREGGKPTGFAGRCLWGGASKRFLRAASCFCT